MSRNLTIVIPAYEPDDNLIILIDKLNSFFNDFNIIVVNDGSLHHDDIFESVKKKDNVTLLTHEVNRGKGEALKTAFRYIKNQNTKAVIVTADSDGQHKPEASSGKPKPGRRYPAGRTGCSGAGPCSGSSSSRTPPGAP